MYYQERLQKLLTDGIDVKHLVINNLLPLVEQAAHDLTDSLLGGGKVMLCGYGSAEAFARYMVTKLISGQERERPGLPVVLLDARLSIQISQHASTSPIAHQICTLGQSEDVLLILGSNDHQKADLADAVDAAHKQSMRIICIAGTACSSIEPHTNLTSICIPSHTAAYIEEIQIALLNALCDLIDCQIFGTEHSAEEQLETI